MTYDTNEKFNLEFNASTSVGQTAAIVERHSVHRAELAETVMTAARMVAELLGEKVPDPGVAPAKTLANGQNVRVRLGTAPDGPVMRAGQVSIDPNSRVGELVIRLMRPLSDQELTMLDASPSARNERDKMIRDVADEARAIMKAADDARSSLLATLVRAAGLPMPTTPNAQAETERALVHALRNWQSIHRVGGPSQRGDGYGAA